MTSPFTGPLVVQNGLFSENAPIGIGTDMNTSSETAVRLTNTTNGKLQISAQNGGAFIYAAHLDLAGTDAGRRTCSFRGLKPTATCWLSLRDM